MINLNEFISIRSTFTRSINIQRDKQSVHAIEAYVPTSRAIDVLEQVNSGLNQQPTSRAIALIGPYGSGKSVFSLFLSALLSPTDSLEHKAAINRLKEEAPELAKKITLNTSSQLGFLKVQINGTPDSLQQQIIAALLDSVQKVDLSKKIIKKLEDAIETRPSMDTVIQLFEKVQDAWADKGGNGVLLVIDELGKFLEYESFHPQHREMHLLQLLAEHAHKGHKAPLHVLVMLHQSFEHYTQRLGKHLREEWQKVQGRFAAIAFLEPAEQALRVVSAAFEQKQDLKKNIADAIEHTVKNLIEENALPTAMDEVSASAIFKKCYPLHPVTLLILPTLCQKVAQNERTLFSYLSSTDAFGLTARLSTMSMGEWIEPWELYDYFMINQPSGFSDPITYQRWLEVVTALERFDNNPVSPEVKLLKTIGLLNIIGSQKGLKASRGLLTMLFTDKLSDLLASLSKAAVINFRSFNQEYRVWQGSDFDLQAALDQGISEIEGQFSLSETLNKLSPLKPIVARKVSFEFGTLRYFVPVFTDNKHWRNVALKQSSNEQQRLWFYLLEEGEKPILPTEMQEHDVIAFCHSTDLLRQSVLEWIVLKDLPKVHSELHQDPVAKREYTSWFMNVEAETHRLLDTLIGQPKDLTWYFGSQKQVVSDKRILQAALSSSVESYYTSTPKIKNELINWDSPSSSANTGRKRLMCAMITHPDYEDLGIEKTPPEKSIYLSLLKASKLHRKEAGQWGFYEPKTDDDPCRITPIWHEIHRLFGERSGQQIPVKNIYKHLQKPPYGVKMGVLPVVVLTYLLANRREVALYQEDVFCDSITLEHIELLSRRPEMFKIERFELSGLHGEVFNRYCSTILGNVSENAKLLEVVRPLISFFNKLPEYTKNTKQLSPHAIKVREAFQNAKSPAALLFRDLPSACGMDNVAQADVFMEALVRVLRELSQAYSDLLALWREQLSQKLLNKSIEELSLLKKEVLIYKGLEHYTTDKMGLGAFIRRLCESSFESDQAWLESVATLLGKSPPRKWTDNHKQNALLSLDDLAVRLKDLRLLAVTQKKQSNSQDSILIKMIDSNYNERVRIVSTPLHQMPLIENKVNMIDGALLEMDEEAKMAVIALLLKKYTPVKDVEVLENE